MILVCREHCARIGNLLSCGITFSSPAVFVLPSERVTCHLEERTGDAGDVVCSHSGTGKHHIHIEAFIIETYLSAKLHKRSVRIADRRHILIVYKTVSVKVYIFDVSQGNGISSILEIRTVVEFFERIVEAIYLITIVLAYAVTGLVHPRIWVRCLGHIFYSILSIGHVTFYIVTPVRLLLGPSHHDFKSFVLNASYVYRSGIFYRHAECDRNHSESSKDIAPLLSEVIGGQVESAVEELGLKSYTCLLGLLPSHVRVTEHTLGRTIVDRVVYTRTITELVVVTLKGT